MTEPRLKIAVFVDFDNIEIGVKTTLNQLFDVSVILEAIKERGEVVTKVAYGDWKRAGDHGRLLSQHAIRLVQRNLTPGGDKNGADINLALDALEMAFTHHHINAFVIVGGDSDFITLVEKLKQYDKKVFVVGGRQFTSMVMQKNCHEFIAYENLVGRGRGSAERRSGGSAGADIARALPLVKRALKVLVDREVTPQLGLLKSTLLQLDSTFSEREYGVSTFRDFIEKVAKTGTVTLRHAGRSLLVDLADTNGAVAEPSQGARASDAEGAPAETPAAAPADTPQAETVQPGQAIEYARDLFARASQPPRWPMYVRQLKQYFRGVDEKFDERRFGFGNIVDFLRTLQKGNLLRLERDRQGGLRVFAGTALAPSSAEGAVETTAPPTDDYSRVETDGDDTLASSDSHDEGDRAAADRGPEPTTFATGEAEANPPAAATDSDAAGLGAAAESPARKRTRRASATPRARKTATTRRAATPGRGRRKTTEPAA